MIRLQPTPQKCIEDKFSRRETETRQKRDFTHLKDRRSQHGNNKALVHEVQQLLLDHLMGHLHHRIAKLEGVHEQRQLRDLCHIVWRYPVPVDGANLDAVGQTRVKPTQTGHQQRADRGVLGYVRSNVGVLLRKRHAQQQSIARLVTKTAFAMHVRDKQRKYYEAKRINKRFITQRRYLIIKS